MNKAILQRPSSRWQIVSAFTTAAIIHISAVALASLHHQPITPAHSEVTPVEIVDPGEAVPRPPAVDVPLPRLPLPPLPAEFESQIAERPARKSSFAPSRRPGQAAFGAIKNPKALAISAPRPEYPYEARRRCLIGSGVASLVVDPSNGSVISVIMEQSIGNPILDNASISAFKRWRFKTGTPTAVRIPITFNLMGPSY